MAQQYHNPFSAIYLVYPKDQDEYYQQYCRRTGRGSSPDRSPFPRMVDLWFAGLSIAAYKDLTPSDLTNRKTSNMVYGAIFDRDSWRIQVVMLIAIAVEDKIEVVAEPNRMMAIANGLAAAGVPHIVEMLESGDQEPIWNLSDTLADLLGGEDSNGQTDKDH